MTPVFPFGAIAEHENRFCTVVGNEPRNRPGCYGLFDRSNGKWYVGHTRSVQARRKEHEGEFKRKRQALHQQVTDLTRLVFVPLFYFIVDRKFLTDTESALIRSLDAVENGYNAMASKSDPHFWRAMDKGADKRLAFHQSPEFRDAARSWMNTPEAMAKRIVTFADPDVKAHKSANQRAAFARPEVKAKRLAQSTKSKTRSATIKAWWEQRRT